MRRALRPLALAVAVATAAVPGTALASPAGGAGGTRVQIDESFTSQLWTERCGFEVHRREQGYARFWEEPRGRDLVFRGVFSIEITLTGVESGATYTFRDAGTDRERRLDDDSIELAIIGRSFPANTTGRLVEVDEEQIRFSGRAAYDVDEVCAVLSG
jgi:hypothetical protein